jgi:hypothetical protein
MTLPHHVIQHIKTIDIDYGKITITVNKDNRHIDVSVEEIVRHKVDYDEKK